MEINRAACVPLLVQDPYTSVWSGTDAANEGDTIHWSGKKQRIFVSVCLAGSEYRLVGGPPQETEADSQSTGGCQQVMTQVKTYVTATSTTFVYENDAFLVRLVFTTPLLAQDLTLLSRPCSYIDASLDSRIPAAAGEEAVLKVTLTSDLVSSEAGAELIFPAGTTKKGRFISMGRADQHPLGGSGDNVTIDWGYAYLAAQGEKCLFRVGEPGQSITAEVPFEAQSESGSRRDAHLVFAYDDLISANYFGQWRRAYWTGVYPDILAAIDDAMTGREETLARAAYPLLGLQSFFTAGPKEVRAWTVRIGAKAPEAAGVIHSDFEKGFIKAETISYEDYVKLGGESGARDAGRLRMEGKDYVVQDGDVMVFRFNV